MKVFAPKRVLYYANVYDRIRGGYVRTGLPLDGEWIEKDDYFRQVSSGHDINDVVHAKVVDINGASYTVGDLVDSAGHLYPRTVYTSSGDLYALCASYETQKIMVWREPRNYKGKKPPILRLYSDVVRVTRTAMVKILPYTSWNYFTPRVRVLMRVYPTNQKKDYVYANWIEFGVTRDRYGAYSGVGTGWEYFPGLLDVAKAHKDVPKSSKQYHVQQWMFDALAAVERDLYGFLSSGPKPNQEQYDRSGVPSWVQDCSVPTIDHPQEAFLLDEPDIYGNRLDPVLLGKDIKFHNYWRGYLTQHALLAACESFPRLNDNSISNILEIAGFVKALVVDHKIEIPKSLSSAWLAYRYQFSTTVMDVREAIKFVHRHMDLGTLNRTISCRGVSSHDIEGTTVTCRCSVDITPKNLDYLGRIWRALDTYGLTPDFYVIWDMIPYSFIVDWLIPVGGILGTLDADAKYFSGEFYTLSKLCFSLSYTRDIVQDNGNIVKVKCYTRWAGSVPSCLNSYYWFDATSASSKTVWYRILDAASLFIGH